MRIKSMVLLIVVSVLFIYACSLQDNSEELATGKYVMQNAENEDWAWVLLDDENQFEFNRNIATLYIPMGTYLVGNNELILKVNDNEIYKFKIKGNSLIFASREYAESLIEKGTVFELSKNK